MIKSLSLFTLTVLLFGAVNADGQTTQPSPSTRPRTVANPNGQTTASPTPTPRVYNPPATITTPNTNATPNASPTPLRITPGATPTPTTTTPAIQVVPTLAVPNPLPLVALQPIPNLLPSRVRAKLEESKRLLRARVQPTVAGATPTDFVTLAAFDPTSFAVHFITLPKVIFLTRGSDVRVQTAAPHNLAVNVRVLRANGVNTAVQIYEPSGRQLVPVVVQYPIEKFGYFREMAYYTSVHPALLSTGIVSDGKFYVRSMLDAAAKRLRDKGMFISPQLIDIAERLCIVEHVDHDRFRRENRAALYDEIFALYALNAGDTYRYSVSTAGAGGMVQMIPATYRMVRNAHPRAELVPDFVAGMRNHQNALEAMLLYMQDTWNDLSGNSEVTYALSAKLATQPELMSAGYNSNPARLSLYLRRGGSGWRTLIPRETQMYLQIYRSVETLVPRVTPTTTLTTTTSQTVP